MNAPVLLEPPQLQSWEGLIVDTRSPQRYTAGHIPGALNLPLAHVRQQRGAATFVADLEPFALTLGRVGLDRETPVVFYGERGQPDAGYLFWACSYYGHPQVCLLNGGLEGWLRSGQRLSQRACSAPPTTFDSQPQPARRAQRDWLLARIDDPQLCLLDNRSDWEYAGPEALTLQAGHIPGARWLPWEAVLQSDLRFKAKAELKRVFTDAGLRPAQTAVVYCQTGNRSGLVYVGLRLLAHPDVRLYDASWSQWGNEQNLPTEGGSDGR